MATQIRCYGCRAFFDKKEPACPRCEAPRRGQNRYLQTAKLNNHLYAQVGRQQKEAAFMKKARTENPPA